MLRQFTKLVSEAVDEGFERGFGLFIETLEEDTEKESIISESGGLDNVLSYMFDKVIEEANTDEYDDDEPTDEEVDTLLAQLKKEGIVD